MSVEETAKMKVEDVARMSGHSPQTIRLGLRLGIFDFGTAFKREGSENFTYIIYPEKVYELYGKRS
ncbi:MAG: hypothetical protein IJN43_13860 [Ruminococcus sp.]|nr:hypothetical protein [Ruminococcus sp.]